MDTLTIKVNALEANESFLRSAVPTSKPPCRTFIPRLKAKKEAVSDSP